jgi:hypothetical protein
MFICKKNASAREIIGRLNAAAVEALADLAVRFRFVDLGMKVFLRDQQTPEALGALQKARIERWWPIIKEFGIKADDLRSPVRSTAPDHSESPRRPRPRAPSYGVQPKTATALKKLALATCNDTSRLLADVTDFLFSECRIGAPAPS